MSDNGTVRYSPSATGSAAVILSLSATIIAVMAVTCNTLLICVIIKSRLLQTPTNIFIASLAVGEIIIGIFGIPFAAASVLADQWPFSYSLCALSACLQATGRSSSTYSLMAVCVDRCVAVSRPLKYSHLLTLKSSCLILTCIWVLGFIMGLLPLGTWGSYQYAKAYYMCTLFRNDGERQHIVKEVICSYVPATIIILSILQIIREVKSHHRIFSVMPFPVASSSAGGGEIMPGIIPGPRGYNRNTSRALRSLFIVTCGYGIFCLPASCLNIVYQEHLPSLSSQPVVTAFVWVSFLCCVINPVIIIVFNRKFRAQLKAIFTIRQCSSRRNGKDIFTITSGLHTILDATLVLNMVKNEHASTIASTRRQILRLSATQ